jgi:protein-L-isoaspartate(D-aspartate) O-methyltransferase
MSSAILLAVAAHIVPAAAATEAEYTAARAALVEEVASYADLYGGGRKGGFDEAVMRALAEVRRHEFVPPGQRSEAYQNHPLPIGHGQTISQPYIVALMTDQAAVNENDVVLEVGTGSGYQAAILAKLVRQVYSIEIVEPLAQEATERLARLGYENVETRLGDGYYGWEAHAPYDAIIVTAAASHVPPPLIEQLKPGGRMVIPVGGRFTVQYLLLIRKTEQGEIVTRTLSAVRFVPLTGDH